MKHSEVGTVMTSDVVRVMCETPFKGVVELLARHGVSGLPVVDGDEKVIGVVSEADIVRRQVEAHNGRRGIRVRLPWLTRAGRRAGLTVAKKGHAQTAGGLMSTPAVTLHAHDSITEAARTMGERNVKRLPVVDDEERLVGIVSRHDLLQVFLRADEDIRAEVIEEVLARTLSLPADAVTVSVRGGVVELAGMLERRSEIPIALRIAAQVDGVVTVVDHLTYARDDAHREPLDSSVRAIGDNRLRGL